MNSSKRTLLKQLQIYHIIRYLMDFKKALLYRNCTKIVLKFNKNILSSSIVTFMYLNLKMNSK